MSILKKLFSRIQGVYWSIPFELTELWKSMSVIFIITGPVFISQFAREKHFNAVTVVFSHPFYDLGLLACSLIAPTFILVIAMLVFSPFFFIEDFLNKKHTKISKT